MLTFPVGLLSNKGAAVDAILVTMTPTAGFTVGFTLTFTGDVYIDFKDGGGKEALTSGVEKTHLYAGAGTYIAEITGDLLNITQFIADNSRITNITNLKTGLLTNLSLYNNLITGILDLSLSPISQVVNIYNNPFTGIIFSDSGNGTLTQFRAYLCSNLTALDFSSVPLSGLLWTYDCTSLTSITFATSGNGLFTNVNLRGCSLTSLDLSNNPISGSFLVYNNSLNSLIFANTGNGTVTSFGVYNNNLNSLDVSNIILSGNIQIFINASLSSLSLNSVNGAITNFAFYNDSLSNIDFSSFSTSNGVTIFAQNNSFTATEHDNQLINLDATGWINGTLSILTGNTARTSASDTAYNNLISKGWTIT